MRLTSQQRRFIGMNIKGTPKMPAANVAHDVKLALSTAGVVAVQEFRHRSYWRELRKAMRAHNERWRSYPSVAVGIARPVYSGQAIAWRTDQWRVIGRKRRLLHSGQAQISEDRHARAVLLEERISGIPCWFATTHYVVGGDEKRDPSRRRLLLAQDVTVTDELLSDLTATGHPIVFQLDANIRPGSGAWTTFRRMLLRHHAVIIGHHGVEYLFVIQGKHARVHVDHDWIVPASRLKTDHEGRGVTIRLETGGTA